MDRSEDQVLPAATPVPRPSGYPRAENRAITRKGFPRMSQGYPVPLPYSWLSHLPHHPSLVQFLLFPFSEEEETGRKEILETIYLGSQSKGFSNVIYSAEPGFLVNPSSATARV